MEPEKNKPEDFSLLDPQVQECPYQAYKVYRDSPVFKMPETGHYVVSRYEDIHFVVRHPEIFSMDTLQGGGHPYDQKGRIKALFEDGGWVHRTVLSSDGDVHLSYRSLLEHCFTNARMKAIKPVIEAYSNQLIDAFIGDGELEFIEQFCYPLPMMMIAHILGLPLSDLEDLKRWSIAWVQPFGMNTDEEAAFRYAKEHVELKEYLVAKFAEKRRQPDEWIISDLVHAKYNGAGQMGVAVDANAAQEERALTDNELLSIVEQLLVGGNETTTNVMASGMMLLLQNPEQMALLLGDTNRHIKGFVEESLRFESPTQGLYRYTVCDTQLGGTSIPAGSMVHIRFAAANRDDDHFAEAEQFAIQRENAGSHLAFSQGVHHCMGAPLSRMEMKVAFTLLLDRLKNIRLDPDRNDFKHQSGFTLRALEKLWLRFEAAER